MNFLFILLMVIVTIPIILAIFAIAFIIFEGIVMVSEMLFFAGVKLWGKIQKWNK